MNDKAKYDAIIADMDGTLYYQTPVQVCMALSMFFFAVFHPRSLREISIVRDYRKLDAEGLGNTERLAHLAEKYGLPDGDIADFIEKWMIRRPLPFVKMFRDRKLIALLKKAQSRGIKVIVYSDYPVTEKLGALEMTPVAAYSADDVGCLKPDPKGLLKILADNGLSAAGCLFIGDRADKDGKCAEGAGVECLILKHTEGTSSALRKLLGE